MRLTLRTLLAYLDDTLPADQAKVIGQKVGESETARELIDRIKKVTRRRGLSTPTKGENGGPSDPNIVSDYLSDALSSDQVAQFEKACLDSDVHLAEVAACHQILTLLLSEPVRVPPTARQRMYQLVKGRESLPNRKPGQTVPVTGELPQPSATDADEADAAFLLGMTAYSRSEPWQRRAVPLAAAAALLACLAVAIWLAVPGTGRRDNGPADTEVAGAAPAQVPAPPPHPQNQSQAPPKEAGPGKPPTLPPGKAAGAPEAAKPPEKAPEPQPGKLVPDAVKPKADRQAVGKLQNTEAVVVSRAGSEDKWLRATAKNPELFTTDRVVCLPGYKAKVLLDPATELELWANVPEQQPRVPVLETAVTFYPAADGFDADFALHVGRVYLVSKRTTGSKVRLRFREEVWDLTVPDDKAEVVVEVVNTLVRGVTKDIDPSELPLTSVGLTVTKGTAGLKVRYKDLPQIKANEEVRWTSKGPGLKGPSPVDPGLPGGASAYFSRYELPVGEQAKAAQEALAELSTRAADRDSIRVALAEMLRDDAVFNLPRIIGARLAILGQAALGDQAALVDALNDGNHPFVRDAAAFALMPALAATPGGVEQFRKRLADKLSLTPEQTAFAVRLIRGFAQPERTSSEAVDRVVDGLSSNVLVIRELAFWAVRSLIDPDVPPSRAQMMFDAAGPPENREPSVKAWQRYVAEELKQQGGPAPKKK